VHGHIIGGVPLPHDTVQSELPVQLPEQPALHEPSTVVSPLATNVQLPPAQLTAQHVSSPQSNVQPPPGQPNVQLDIPLHVMSQLPLGQSRSQSLLHVQLALPPLPPPFVHAPVSSEPSPGVPSVELAPSFAITCASSLPPPPDTLEKPMRPHAASSTSTPPRTRRLYYGRDRGEM
jgi:hypothetical protein